MSTSSPKEEAEQAAESPPDDPDAQMNQDQNSSGPLYEFEVKEQDRWLPIANVARIMKMALPENAKIAKDAKETMQECVSEFIAFVTSEASEKCYQEKRKTVNGEDILFAMTSLGFENYAETLKIYLSKYRETQSSRSENRPASQGFGATGVAGSANTNSTPSFPGNEEPTSSILTGQGEGEQEQNFGGMYRYQTSGEGGATDRENY